MNSKTTLGWLVLAAAASLPALAQTTLHLTSLPPTTPAGQPIYAGSFNNWQPAAAGYALARQPDGTYQLTLPATVRGPQEFKFTRGSWETGEADASYQPVANRHADAGVEPATLSFQVIDLLRRDINELGRNSTAQRILPAPRRTSRGCAHAAGQTKFGSVSSPQCYAR